MIEAALCLDGPAWSRGTSMVHVQGAMDEFVAPSGPRQTFALDSLDVYWALGNTPFDREARYRAC